jgi:hypothetical protein
MSTKHLAWLAALIPTLASAGGEVAAAQITYIGTWTPHVDISTAATAIDPDGCGYHDFYRVDLQNDPTANAKLASIIAAFSSGKVIGLSLQGCVGDRPKIIGVRVYQ